MTVLQALRRARDLIAKVGFCKNNYCKPKNKNASVDDYEFAVSARLDKIAGFCIEGAVARACRTDSRLDLQVQNLLSKNITNTSLNYFNDKPERRKRDVIRLFDKTIKQCIAKSTSKAS